MRKLAGLAVLATILVQAAGAATLPEAAAFDQILGYKVGANADALNRVRSTVVQSHGDAELSKLVEARLLDALKSPEATTDCKRFVCRQLVDAGTVKSVPALAALLPDAELSHMGLYALARFTCPEAGQALREALGKTKGKPLVGVVNAIGDRRDAKALSALTGLAKSRESAVREAAIVALGKIGGKEAAACLLRLDLASSNAKGRAVIVSARLLCADRAVEAGDKATALATYTALYKPSERLHIRAAALRGLLIVQPEKTVDLLSAALMSKDKAMGPIAIGFLRDVKNPEATRTFAAKLPSLAPETQALVIDALADRGDAAARAAVMKAAGSPHEAVQTVAVQALAGLGDASTVPLLTGLVASPKAGVAGAARTSLSRLSGDGVNAAIIKAMQGAAPPKRVELIKILAIRRADEAVPVLLKGAADPNKDVARESFNALRGLAGEKAVAGMVELLIQAKDTSARGAAERAIITIVGKSKDEAKRLDPILAALPKSTGKAKAALLRIAGKFGGDKALAIMRAALKSGDADAQDAALRTLVAWPDAAPVADLYQLVKSGDSLKVKVLAMQGYVRLLTLPSDQPATEILKKFEEAMTLAPRVEEKKLVISALADLRHPAALEMLKPYLADKTLGAEAKAAAAKITKALSAPARVTASVRGNLAKNAIDGNKGTRWDTGAAMKGGEWFVYELAVEHAISGLELEQAKSPNDHPRGYEVYISRDGKSWGKAVAAGKGTRPVTKISFKPTYGRFIKIVQTGKAAGNFWSIHTMKVHSKLAAQK